MLKALPAKSPTHSRASSEELHRKTSGFRGTISAAHSSPLAFICDGGVTGTHLSSAQVLARTEAFRHPQHVRKRHVHRRVRRPEGRPEVSYLEHDKSFSTETVAAQRPANESVLGCRRATCVPAPVAGRCRRPALGRRRYGHAYLRKANVSRSKFCPLH